MNEAFRMRLRFLFNCTIKIVENVFAAFFSPQLKVLTIT